MRTGADIRTNRQAGPIRRLPGWPRCFPRTEALSEQLRIDKWLWHARFCRTRAIAQQKAHQGRIRLNGQGVRKASSAVRIGDTMTLAHLGKVMVIKVRALGVRRGPAGEASALYEVLEDGATER